MEDSTMFTSVISKMDNDTNSKEKILLSDEHRSYLSKGEIESSMFRLLKLHHSKS